MSNMLDGKICLVTGAGTGIGKAIAQKFAKEGAIVYANVYLDSMTEGLLDGLNEDEVKRIIIDCYDITDNCSVKKAIMKIKKQYKKLDVLVNSAGLAYNEKIGMMSMSNIEKMFKVNVFALLEITQLTARLMMRQNNGSIINISSMVGLKGDKGQTAYSASKGAVISITRSAAKELAPYNIRVNSVAPGLTETDMFRQTDESFLEERLSNIGMNRIAKPEEIADACIFLASDYSTYITGQILGVDGSAII
jgi:3-oxoacyl-[acyl-carrier protein] reductase